MRILGCIASVILLSTPACHPRTGAATVDDSGSVAIKIVNGNRLDVVLYVAHDAYRERLGDVTANTTRTFELKFRSLGAGHEFSLIADPVGSLDPIRTEVLHPQDGQVVTWTLESDFSRSHVQIF